MRPDLIHKALGSEVRKKIILSLAKKEKYLSEVAHELHMPPQTVDFHLNMLVESGIISYKWEKGKKYYFLKDKKILKFLKKEKPIPPEFKPKPPHEIMLDAWNDLAKRLDRIEKKLDLLLSKNIK